jgi:hypothetical protein
VDQIGSTVAVANLVTAQLSRVTRTLAVGDVVRQNELIEVASDGSGEFKLKDDTKLALGPGSRLTLDKFVYDPANSGSGNSIALRFAKGAFRFITGVAEKPAYVIRVPAASITVRGTIFDVFVEDSGTSWLLLHEGGVRVCNDTGACRDLSEPGKLIKISDGGTLSKPTKWASLPGVDKISFDSAFPFVVTPPSIDPKPVFTREALLKTTSDTIDAPAPKRKAEVPKKKPERYADADPKDFKLPPSKRLPKTKLDQAKLSKMKDAPKKDRYDTERDRGLDIAHDYAPKAIDKVRKEKYVDKGDTVDTGNGNKGWRSIVDKYYKPH